MTEDEKTELERYLNEILRAQNVIKRALIDIVDMIDREED